MTRSALCDSPRASTTSTGSTSNGVLQYSLNMVATVLTTMLALARSVAVHSMNTSRVSSVICAAQAIARFADSAFIGRYLRTSFSERTVSSISGPVTLTAGMAALMIGGSEQTVRRESMMTGYTTLSRMMGTKRRSFRSFSS